MHVMLICGSIAEKSHTKGLVKELSLALNEQDIATTTWDLRTTPLPIADPSYHSNPDQYPDANVVRFIEAARKSDGFALASPLYHGSFSGALKNALDHLWYDAFRNKPVALLSHGANERKCSQPCTALQQVVSTLFGYSLQTQVATSMADYSYDTAGQAVLDNPEIKARVKRQAEELLKLMKSLSAQQPE